MSEQTFNDNKPDAKRSHADLCYLAGLFEGEGCYSIKQSGAIVVTMQMTDEDIVRRVAAIAGVGRVYGPYDQTGPRAAGPKPTWVWTVAAQADAAGLMMTLWSFMGERRREQIEKCLAVWRARPNYRVGGGMRTFPHWSEPRLTDA